MKTRIRLYYQLWLVITVLFFVVRFTAFLSASYDARFGLLVGSTVFLCIVAVGVHVYEYQRLIFYLKANHRDFWEYLTFKLPLLGHGHITKSHRVEKFLLSKDDFGDPSLAFLKSNYRKLLLLSLLALLTYPFMVLACIL